MILFISGPSIDGEIFRKRVSKELFWCVTKETNGHFVWRVQCVDAQPWEESDYTWVLKSIHRFAKNEAIEACLLSALKEISPPAQVAKDGAA